MSSFGDHVSIRSAADWRIRWFPVPRRTGRAKQSMIASRNGSIAPRPLCFPDLFYKIEQSGHCDLSRENPISVAPRIVEPLLEALCPPSPFRDGVLGDLAEDYLRRRCEDGPLAARRWYYAQAFASAPHLVGHWARHVSFGAWIALTASGIVTMTTAVGVVLALQVAFVTWWGNAPDSMGIVYAAWRDAREAYPLITYLMLQSEWLVVVLGGYLVGRRHGQAPLAAAGAAAMTTSILVMLILRSPLVFGLWFNLGRWTLCMLIGGASYALSQRRHARYQMD